MSNSTGLAVVAVLIIMVFLALAMGAFISFITEYLEGLDHE